MGGVQSMANICADCASHACTLLLCCSWQLEGSSVPLTIQSHAVYVYNDKVLEYNGVYTAGV